MFSDYHSEVVNIKSNWRSNRKTRDNLSQTSEVMTDENSTQTFKPSEAGTQTISADKFIESRQKTVTYNESTLAKFLTEMEPVFSRQLKMNVASSAFDEYLWDIGASSMDYSIASEYCLDEKSILTEKNDDLFEVTSISWSSNGSSIAISYGTTKDAAWGQNRSYLAVWNIDRPRMNVTKCDHKLELESSAQIVRFNPSQVGIIACGLYSGILLVWRLSDDSVVYSSDTHNDSITEICWMNPQSYKYHELVSTSTDGHIFLWTQKVSTRQPHPIKLVKKMKVKTHRVQSRITESRGTGLAGITCCTSRTLNNLIGVDDTNTLLIGCGNGGVAKCIIEDNPALLDPVVFSYEGHLGPVYSVDWSPFNRHVFLTCSTDYTCRIFHSLQQDALAEFSPFSSIEQSVLSSVWSPVRALTIFSIGASGMLSACNVKNAKTIVTNSDFDPKVPYTCMSIHPKRHYYIATGNSNGTVHIWRLGDYFIEHSTSEENELKAFAEQTFNEE